MSFRPQKKYPFLKFTMLVALLILGIGFGLLTYSFLQAINTSTKQVPEQSPINRDILLLGITMLAGLPAIGIGTYVTCLGNQMRTTSPRNKGHLIMVSGGLIILCGLVLPLVVWWMSQTL